MKKKSLGKSNIDYNNDRNGDEIVKISDKDCKLSYNVIINFSSSFSSSLSTWGNNYLNYFWVKLYANSYFK